MHWFLYVRYKHTFVKPSCFSYSSYSSHSVISVVFTVIVIAECWFRKRTHYYKSVGENVFENKLALANPRKAANRFYETHGTKWLLQLIAVQQTPLDETVISSIFLENDACCILADSIENSPIIMVK